MRQILKYTSLTIISLLMSGLYAIIDGLFIGQSTGDVGLAAINIAWPIPALFIATGLGLGVGGSIYYSQNIGQRNNHLAFNGLITTYLTLFIVACFFMIFFYFSYPTILTLLNAQGAVYQSASEYLNIVILGCVFYIISLGSIPILRNIGLPFYAMLISSTGIILNIFFNYNFIIIQEMGVKGAALGTLYSQIISCILMILLYILKGKFLLKLKDPSIKIIPFNNLKLILKNAIAPFGLSLMPSIILIFSNYTCLHYGSTEGVAAYTVLSYITFPMSSMLLGIGDGLQPLMSLKYGENNKTELDFIIKTGYKLGLGLVVTLMLGLFFTSKYVGSGFNLSPVANSYFNEAIIYATFALPFIFLFKYAISVANATANTKKASTLTYLEGLIISPILIIVLALLFSLTGVWLSYLIANIMMVFIAYIIYH